jgi:chromosome transmission fidelity protein 18
MLCDQRLTNHFDQISSDDRTGEVVKSKIKAALEMQAIVNDPNSANNNADGNKTFMQKPNLLIIDEIDGASSGGGNDVGP